jgi:hypothetical protein
VEPQVVFDLCRSWFGDATDSPPDLIDVLRERSPRLISTYLSASLALGETAALSPVLQAELDEVAARSVLLGELQRRIGDVVPDAWFLKGGDLGALYAPLVRYRRDVDVVVSTTDELWAAGRMLAEDGFAATTLLAVPLAAPGAGRMSAGLMIEFRRPAASAWEHDLKAEVSTLFWVGNGRTVPSVPRGDVPTRHPGARHLLAITARALTNHEFNAKDVLDAHLLLADGGTACGAAARDLASRFGVNPELNRLLDLVEAHLPDYDDAGRLAARSDRRLLAAARVRRGAHLGRGMLTRPRAALALMAQHRVLMEERWLPSAVWPGLVARTGPDAPFGPWRFGLPCRATGALPAEQPAEIMDTPIGLFVMTPTGSIDPDDLERLQITPVG